MWTAWYVETPGLVFEGPDVGASAASAAFSPVRLGPQPSTLRMASLPPWSPSFLTPPQPGHILLFLNDLTLMPLARLSSEQVQTQEKEPRTAAGSKGQ